MIVPTEGVLIDSTVVRSDMARCCILFEYLVGISDVGPHADLDPGHELQKHGMHIQSVDWYSLEDEIVEAINVKLPAAYICVVGEQNPGDVIVRCHEVGDD
jgi:hypothetical protein